MNKGLGSVIPTEVEESLTFAAYLVFRKIRNVSASLDMTITKSKAEKFSGCSGEQLCFVFRGKLHRFDEFTRFCFT